MQHMNNGFERKRDISGSQNFPLEPNQNAAENFLAGMNL